MTLGRACGPTSSNASIPGITRRAFVGSALTESTDLHWHSSVRFYRYCAGHALAMSVRFRTVCSAPGRRRLRDSAVLLPHRGRAMIATSRFANGNHLLQLLSPADLGLLEPHLVAVTMKLRDRFENPNKPIEFIVFPRHRDRFGRRQAGWDRSRNRPHRMRGDDRHRHRPRQSSLRERDLCPGRRRRPPDFCAEPPRGHGSKPVDARPVPEIRSGIHVADGAYGDRQRPRQAAGASRTLDSDGARSRGGRSTGAHARISGIDARGSSRRRDRSGSCSREQRAHRGGPRRNRRARSQGPRKDRRTVSTACRKPSIGGSSVRPSGRRQTPINTARDRLS